MNITKLVPACKSIIWGGNRLKERYGKNTELSPLAETWELSFHKDGQCTLPDGRPLSEVAGEAELGKNCLGFDFFPVLVKFIDAQDRLSVQVHPSDAYALANENSLGKTEMWYIVDADEGAGIYLGFKENITKDEFKAAIENKTLTDHLRFIPVKRGESYFIPSGTIHAICSGCLICEIQQNSNITYRVYDYGRRDKDGNERELHVAKALDVTSTSAIDPQPLDIPVADGLLKGISRFFTATLVEVSGDRSLADDNASFRCLSCLEGEGSIGGIQVRPGDSIFIPAGERAVALSGSFKALMTTIRKYYYTTESSDGILIGRISNDLGEVIISGCAAQDSSASDLKDGLLKRCGLSESDLEN